jgi:hypothetical protein
MVWKMEPQMENHSSSSSSLRKINCAKYMDLFPYSVILKHVEPHIV